MYKEERREIHNLLLNFDLLDKEIKMSKRKWLLTLIATKGVQMMINRLMRQKK